MSEESAPSQRTHGGAAWIAYVLLFLVLYVLSIGPFDCATNRKLISKPVAEKLTYLYTPIGVACYYSPAVEDLLSKYLRWCRLMTGTE